MIFNDRLLRFHSAKVGGALVPPGRWNGALVLDANQDGHTDLLVVGPAQSPLLLLGQIGTKDEDKLLLKGNIHSPPLIQAQALDIDLDGWTDIVGLSDQRKPVLLHNGGRQLAHAQEGLGLDADWPADLVAVVAADFTGDGLPDIMVWSESKGLQLRANQGNGNHALLLA